ncbi:MAG: winged helix-turn-helix domain-containing protein, partial [Candidatus Korarchaeota archaeon]|nr:winged helix-turn-helix domain-containing protein [Candidatus Korarchaeota archaeon]
MPRLEGGSGGPAAGGGSLRERFLEAVEEASRELRLPIARDLPERVTLEPLRVEKGYRSGASEVHGGLTFSSLLPPRRLEQAVRREAAIFLLPRDLLRVEEILDLAWAYAGADESWWRECTRVRWGLPLPPYDAPSLFAGLDRGEVVAVVRATLRTLAHRARAGSPPDFFSYYAVLLASLGKLAPPKLVNSHRKVLRALSRNPYLSQGGLKEATGLSPASVSRAVRYLTSVGMISGPQQVNYLAMGFSSLVVSVPRGEVGLRRA